MATQSPPINFADVDTSRFECLDGQLIERPVPSVPHGKLLFRIATAIAASLHGSTLDVSPESSVNRWDEVNSDWLTPDVIVSKAGGFRLAANGHALPPISLAIEVLSPQQTYNNMRRKVATLIGWGAGEVWLVDQSSKSVAVFRSPDTSRSEIIFEGIVATADAAVSLNLNDLFPEQIS